MTQNPNELAIKGRLSLTLPEASAATGLAVKFLRAQGHLGNLRITQLSARKSVILVADLEAFLERARARSA